MWFILVRLLLFAVIGYLIFKAIRISPPVVRRVSLVLFLAGLAATEAWMRHQGDKPYFIVPSGYANCLSKIVPVDSVVDYHDMTCDSFGVNKLTPHAKTGGSPFLNSEGFPSLYEFNQAAIDTIHAQGKKAVMLIGDSYTYGMCADSGKSFAYLLQNTGRYGILNAGVPGTDMPQYRAVTDEYIGTGKIKPDEVVICINGANDLGHFPDRKLTPGIPILFSSNVGGLYSFQGGYGEDTVYPSAKSAYKNILNRYTVLGILGDGFWARLLGHSCLLSRGIGCFKNFMTEDFGKVCPDMHFSSDPAFKHISRIKAICDSAQVPVLFALLPGKTFVAQQKSLQMDGVVTIDPTGITLSDYTPAGDDHPLNSGHRKLAEKIEQIIEMKQQQ